MRYAAGCLALGCLTAPGCRELPALAPLNTLHSDSAAGTGAGGRSTGGSSTGGGSNTGGNTTGTQPPNLPTTDPLPPVGDPLSAATPGLTTQNGQLMDRNGAPVLLHGLIWQGFSTGSMVAGFPQNETLNGDVATVVRRMYLLGFNAVRLPFSFQQLLSNTAPTPINGPCNHTSQAALAASITAPGQTPGVAYELPVTPIRQTGRCNDYVPSDSTLNRFVWLVQFLAHNGFYVVLTNDLHNDNTALASPAAWMGAWATLVSQLTQNDEAVAQHLLLDLLHEPDSDSLTWSAVGQTPGLGDLYLGAMESIAQVTRSPLYLIEGCGQGPLGTNWGDGFDTNAVDLQSSNMSDPRPFFAALVTRPYAARTLLAPHVFGPDVTFNGTASSGAPLYARLSASFGTLGKTGFCLGSSCTHFATVIGAFGSAFAQVDADQTMADLGTYMDNLPPANDDQHIPITSWIYWTWEPGQSGSLQTNTDGDLAWNKLTHLGKSQHLKALPNAP